MFLPLPPFSGLPCLRWPCSFLPDHICWGRPPPMSSSKTISFPCPSGMKVPTAPSLYELLNDPVSSFDPAPDYKSLITEVSRKIFQKSTRKIWLNGDMCPILAWWDFILTWYLCKFNTNWPLNVKEFNSKFKSDFYLFDFEKNHCKMDLEAWINKWIRKCWKQVNWGDACSPRCENLLYSHNTQKSESSPGIGGSTGDSGYLYDTPGWLVLLRAVVKAVLFANVIKWK